MVDRPQTTPRDVIAAALVKLTGSDQEHDDRLDADVILAALTAAGFTVQEMSANG